MDKLDIILEKLSSIDNRINSIDDKLEAMEKKNQAEHKEIHRKLDTMISATAKNTEDITELKAL
ncbi:hypothetical protein [Dehalobacter sp. TBBPA1]|uniref:hypothetical protein n=1 Tax=Dehalobacter sp. TBBPA1 TaxID=3235037 RepID=UPI0034A35F6D